MSDHEGQGHKAVVYKSHFPATKALHSHSVVTETPADTLANKPRLLQRPSSWLFMPHDTLHKSFFSVGFGLCLILCENTVTGIRVKETHRTKLGWFLVAC